MKVVSAAQMRELDRMTIEDYKMPSLVLMENAALRVVHTIAERYSPLVDKRITVVCGKGNNGGDGLAIARHLSARCGANVTVWLVADPNTLTGDAAANCQMAKAFGVTFGPPAPNSGGARDLIVDALLGTGAKGAARGEVAAAIEAINQSGCPVMSVDIPSGLDADTGKAEGAVIRAACTITFALPKFGLLTYPGAEYTGELIVADIGMPRQVMAASASNVTVTEHADIARWLPARVEGRDANKGTFGHVTIFAGSRGFVGAAVMAAEAAARAGAGLVTLAVPEGIQEAVMCHVSPVVMTRGLPQTSQGAFSQMALEPALELAAKGTAAAIGPGLGLSETDEGRAFVHAFVSRCMAHLVIDADALNALAMGPERGTSATKNRPRAAKYGLPYATVLTPHPGEMARLLFLENKAIQEDRRGAAVSCAAEFGAVALLKGSRTLIAAPDGALAINTTGNAGMASGGTGDTLTGMIAAFLAQGLSGHDAAATGAYVHGLAGDMVAERHGGKTGLIATDIIDFLPRAIARCQGIAP